MCNWRTCHRPVFREKLQSATGEHATGEHATGEHATGEHATGEHATGEHVRKPETTYLGAAMPLENRPQAVNRLRTSTVDQRYIYMSERVGASRKLPGTTTKHNIRQGHPPGNMSEYVSCGEMLPGATFAKRPQSDTGTPQVSVHVWHTTVTPA
jgi:hypothetical protein